MPLCWEIFRRFLDYTINIPGWKLKKKTASFSLRHAILSFYSLSSVFKYCEGSFICFTSVAAILWEHIGHIVSPDSSRLQKKRKQRNYWSWRLSRWFQAFTYISYPLLSHAIENTANQKARIPLHIPRYFTKKSRRSSRPTKAFIQLTSSTYLNLLIFYKNYVLSRNVANLLNIFSLILFAVKALKIDVLC